MPPPPALSLSYSPAGPTFAITEQATMPQITVTASFQNFTPPAGPPLQYQWKVTLRFNGANCKHALGRVITHPEIQRTTPTNTLVIPFTAVRGGELTVTCSVKAGTSMLTATSKDLKITGTDPSIGSLQANTAGEPEALKKLMRLESQLRQFLSPTCPLFSQDNLGGVGICQLTSPKGTPPPTDDQVWSWKENLKAGKALYKEKETTAKHYPAHVRKSPEFLAQVKRWNDQRMADAKAGGGQAPAANVRPPAALPNAAARPQPGAAAGAGAAAALKPLVVDLPDYTDEQLQKDTIRGFNGYAGGLHEYRPRVDKNDMLVVTVDASGTTAKAEWERLTADERKDFYDLKNIPEGHRGDPNYVDDVLKQDSF